MIKETGIVETMTIGNALMIELSLVHLDAEKAMIEIC